MVGETATPVSLTCRDLLLVLRPALVEPLFAPAAVERLLSVTQILPGDCLGVLESRLASGSDAVDLAIRLLDPPEARRMAEHVQPAQLWSFLSRWAETDGPFAAVRSVWLEFDMDREAGKLPDPIPCAKIHPAADPVWVADALLPALAGKTLARSQRDLWLSCQAEIPPPGRILYVFSLHPRKLDAVRMEIFGMNPRQILDYLGRVAPAALPQAGEIVPLFEGVERLHLSFDLSPEGVLPRIGIEGSFPHLPRSEPRWRALFDRLEDRGLCDSGKRDATFAWQGYDTFWTAPQRWPVGAVGARGFCVRTLSHVKAVCQPGREPEAKAYFAFCYAGGFKASRE